MLDRLDRTNLLRYGFIALAIIVLVSLGSAKDPVLKAAPTPAALPPVPDLDPAALTATLPSQIKWKDGGNGSSTAVLYGDPDKPGLYVILTKWTPHHNSRPHYHPNDRLVTVLQGTWWVQTGAKYDPEHFVPMPTGTFVVHHAKTIHYDGAKDADTVLEIVGMGPATQIPAEQK
jgi:quercetin dioxygenase-like cupin family protein